MVHIFWHIKLKDITQSRACLLSEPCRGVAGLEAEMSWVHPPVSRISTLLRLSPHRRRVRGSSSWRFSDWSLHTSLGVEIYQEIDDWTSAAASQSVICTVTWAELALNKTINRTFTFTIHQLTCVIMTIKSMSCPKARRGMVDYWLGSNIPQIYYKSH